MAEVTQILMAIRAGNLQATEELLPLMYDELRRLASQRLSREPPGQTLQATALVHEAYLRLLTEEDRTWENRRQFFAAAAEAMRRILIENARRKLRIRQGMGNRLDASSELELTVELHGDDLLSIDEALEKLGRQDASAALLVKLRYFAGLTMTESAEVLGVSTRTAERNWTYARTWLRREMADTRPSFK